MDKEFSIQSDQGVIVLPYRTLVPRTAIVTVTPAAAEWILEYSLPRITNRAISDDRVAEYGGKMLAGEFDLNGESMVFDVDGVLLDGWTRCWAAHQHGATFRSVAAFGMPREAMDSIDTGRKRTLSNVFTMKGEKEATVLVGGVGWVFRYEQRRTEERLRAGHDEFVACLGRHPMVRESVKVTAPLRRKRFGPPSVLVAAHYICSRECCTAANEFFALLATGEELKRTSPIYQLRERLIAITDKRNADGERMSYILRAWQLWRAGESASKLRLPEKMPEIEAFFTMSAS